MAWIEPIFDRTEDDILAKTSKAYITYQDLNRIEENIDYLATKLQLSNITTKNWDLKPIPKEEDMQRILDSLSKICDAWKPNGVTLPRPPINDYLKFNKIEEIEFIIKENLAMTDEASIYCGEVFSGEMGVI